MNAPVHVLDGEARADERHIQQRFDRVVQLLRLGLVLVRLGHLLKKALDERRMGIDL